MNWRIVQGDIAAMEADAVVNAAGTSLAMGSGVAGALRRKGGEEIHREAVAQGPIPLGEVAVTGAYRLPARYVLHAAAMPHYGDGRATAESIRQATRRSLEKADELGCHTIALPALGCGVAGFDLAAGVRIILEVLADYQPKHLRQADLVLYSDAEQATGQAVARSLQGGD